MTIQKLAARFSAWFIEDTRDDGNTFIKTPINCPSELTDLIFAAHGDMLPDDYRYQFIREALDAIANCDDVDDIELEADIYNSDLTHWLNSRNDRAEYVNEYVKAVDIDTKTFDLMQLIGCGQYLEKQEVLGLVLTELQKLENNE